MEAKPSAKKILILDDEPHVVTYLEILLRDHDYETVTAQNGIEGLAKVKTEHPDLITLDLSMPEKSGMRFYQELKADPELNRIPVVIVTALTGQMGLDPVAKLENEHDSLSPPDGFVAKPIEQEEFLSVIAAALKSPSAKSVK